MKCIENAELEILLLHEKMDALREQQWQELIQLQQQQIGLLEQLLADKKATLATAL